MALPRFLRFRPGKGQEVQGCNLGWLEQSTANQETENHRNLLSNSSGDQRSEVKATARLWSL